MLKVSLKRAVQLGGRPRGLWLVYVTGVVSALIVPAMLIILGMVTDLFATRGNLEVPAAEAENVAQWAGPADRSIDDAVIYDARGLLPFVYRHQDNPLVGSALIDRCGATGWMQSNRGSLVVLLLTGTLLAAFECLTLGVFLLTVRRAALEVGSHLRGAVYNQAFRLGVFDLLGDRVTQAEQLIVEQVPQVEEGLTDWWQAAGRSVVLLVTAFVVALAAQVWLAMVILLFAILAWLLHGWLGQRTQSQVRLCADRASRELDRLIEQIRQAPLVAGYMLSQIPGEPMAETLRRFRQHSEQGTWGRVLVGPVLLLFAMAGGALILALAGVNVLFREPPLTIAAIVVLGTSLVVAVVPARRFLSLRETLPLAERSATAITTYLDREPSVIQAPAARPLGRIRDKIEFETVTLADRHGGKLLDNVSLTIPARSEIAIVSSDSTVPIALSGLLARFYDPAAGRILADGQELRMATLQSVRQQISLIAGDGQLFTGTVLDNIACGETKYTQVQISDAAKQASANEFVQKLPHGLATIIGEQGDALDAGQAFRIALARISLRDPSLVVVQEPRGDIDEASVELAKEALRRVTQDRTVILLPTRLETLRDADKVILLHEGKVAGEGTHTELIQASELYRHLTYVRFNRYRGQVDTD